MPMRKHRDRRAPEELRPATFAAQSVLLLGVPGRMSHGRATLVHLFALWLQGAVRTPGNQP